MGPLRSFHDLPVKYRLLASYSAVFVLSVTLGSMVIYALVRPSIQANIDNELSNYTSATLNMVRTAVSVSIKNHLRAVAERNREIAAYYYHEYLEGRLSEAEAKERAAAVLLSQKIGETGYIYCVDSTGLVVVHRSEALRNVNVADFPFVREQMSRKEGYIEYEWKNPGETTTRPKALYMTYFQPWDWIISVSSYREEFSMLVNTDDFRESILSLRCGETGYSFVVDGKGNVVIHPKLEGQNLMESRDTTGRRIGEEMCRRKSGKIIYSWQNPDESAPREKVVIFNYVPELDWIVASSGYLDEFYAPLTTVRNAILVMVAASLALFLPIAGRISSSITNPLQQLMRRFSSAATGDLSGRVDTKSRDEIGQLAAYFNTFMERLEEYNKSLKAEIQDRKQAEQALRVSEEMFSKAFSSSPNGICITSLDDSRFINVNESLLAATGYSREELIGRTVTEVNLFPDPEEGARLVHWLQEMGHLRNREIEFLTKAGDVRIGVVSAELIELGGRPAMLSTIEDVTASRRMEREIMDIADLERQRIGQDLHDDLCPHLIGIEVLSKVLNKKLEGKALEEAADADKIRELIGEAVDKTRSFARGLCPVHFAAYGLEAALKDLAAKASDLFGVTCRFEFAHPVQVHDNTVATHLFYIAQEAVHNAIRHGDADHILIELSTEDNRISLEIRDNGHGIPVGPPRIGMGLRIMGYRAKLIGSTLEIESDAGCGTTVKCSLRDYERKGPDSQ